MATPDGLLGSAPEHGTQMGRSGFRQSRGWRFGRALFANRLAIGATLILATFIGAAVIAPWLPIPDPTRGQLRDRLQPPSREHVLGTDQQGRDMLSRVIWGSRIALTVGGVALAIGLVFGVCFGILSGYFGGVVDTVIMRFIDLLLSVPTVLLVIGIITIIGPNLVNAMIAIGVTMIAQYARIIRSTVLSIKSQDYIVASIALGSGRLRTLTSHVLPNCMAPIIVISSVVLARAILAEATLSFLGLGVQPPHPAWGTMVAVGRDYLRTHPHLSIVPGVATMLVVFSLNIFGDALRDVLDPKT